MAVPTQTRFNPVVRVIERALESDAVAYRLTPSQWAVPSESRPGTARIVTDMGGGYYRCNCPRVSPDCRHIGAVLLALSSPPTVPGAAHQAA